MRAALIVAAALATSPALAQSPEALCAKMLAVAKADPAGPRPIPPDVCMTMLTQQRRVLGTAGWTGFAACIEGAKRAADIDQCNPARFAPAGPPAPTVAPLPSVPADGPFEQRVVALLRRVVALAERHRPACTPLNRALDQERQAHAALVAQITALRSKPQAARLAALKAVQGEVVQHVAALTPLMGICKHDLLMTLVGSL